MSLPTDSKTMLNGQPKINSFSGLIIGVAITFRISINYSVNGKACRHKKMPNIYGRLADIN
jgi:hypothetical protein|tara:strand:+ start:162 stop:344 length:183 start_codon:yes stop_codon:yes gene_type:complete